MQVPNFQAIKTADNAKQLAMMWQDWQSEQELSYGDLAEWHALFVALTHKFPELYQEFKENAII